VVHPSTPSGVGWNGLQLAEGIGREESQGRRGYGYEKSFLIVVLLYISRGIFFAFSYLFQA
jgi:hypothetical protein